MKISSKSNKKKIKLTPWECGQELIKAYDMLCDCSDEIRSDMPRLADLLSRQADEIAFEFNELKTHEFGLGASNVRRG